ncbi:DNA mismatch repair protein MSH6 [Camellia lanceoleosa]|uniref:DNA mismatch repair protein MSH6 n=1 Tax=Camellia lanceoleosa TaxID=1840588 RepID=A0ACC0H9R4_9ERIC|nr:DNA mismatch repair protein MSH6 [Camellia lanceoleosa]
MLIGEPGDVNYDPTTLYLPPDFVKSLSGGQRQWWEFKSKHMDMVLFFKMGKFYELFEMDAHVGAKELDLQYMKGDQPHCGFPEKNFSINVEKLARKGYRVLVVEQTETPEQLELRRKEKSSKDKVFNEDVGQDKRLGIAKLKLIELEAETPKEVEVRLLPSLDMLKIKDKKDRGTLTVKVLYHQFNTEEQLAALEAEKMILEERKKLKAVEVIRIG